MVEANVLFLRDASFEREDANPLDAILVMLTHPHVDVDHDTRMALTGTHCLSHSVSSSVSVRQTNAVVYGDKL